MAVPITTPILAPGGGRIVFFPAAHSGGAACREDSGSDVGFNTFAFLSFVLTVVNAIGWASGDGAECHFRDYKRGLSTRIPNHAPLTHSVIANNDNNRRNNNNNNDNQNNNNQVSLNEGNLVAMQMETGGRKRRSPLGLEGRAFAMAPWSVAQIAVRMKLCQGWIWKVSHSAAAFSVKASVMRGDGSLRISPELRQALTASLMAAKSLARLRLLQSSGLGSPCRRRKSICDSASELSRLGVTGRAVGKALR